MNHDHRSLSSAQAIIGLILGALLVIHALAYYPYMPDDSFISFQYAKRWATGFGLTWTSGAPVEGFSNFLWVIILGCLRYFGLDIVESARLLGILCTMGTVYLLMYVQHTRQEPSSTSLIANSIAALVLVTSGIIAAWAVGGLEQALLGFLLAAGVRNCYPLLDCDPTENPAGRQHSCSDILASICFALLAMVRPDAPLFGVLAGACVLLVSFLRYQPLGPGIRIIVWTLGATLGLTAFRLAYFGDWVPNTAHVKLALTWHFLWQGVRYVAHGLLLYAVPFGALIGAIWIARNTPQIRRRMFLLLTLIITWLLYMIFMGGDINPPSRHFVPALILCCFAISEGAYGFFCKPGTRITSDIIIWGIPLLAFHLLLQVIEPELKITRSPREFFIEDNIAVGKALRDAFGDRDPLLAIDGAGITPFMSDFRSLDLLGLNDAQIAKTSPEEYGSKELGNKLLGHELGNVEYVLERKPDLVLFGSYKGNWQGAFPGGIALASDPRFKKHYVPVLLRVPSPMHHTINVELYVRIDGKLGIRTNPEKSIFTVPAYLLSPPQPSEVVYFGDEKKVLTSLFPESRLPRITLIKEFFCPNAPSLSSIPQINSLPLAGIWDSQNDTIMINPEIRPSYLSEFEVINVCS